MTAHRIGGQHSLNKIDNDTFSKPVKIAGFSANRFFLHFDSDNWIVLGHGL